jgi:colanic acid biosynthesis glycosyl transferase WcaI
MKKILIAAPNYYPETGAAAKRITAMAEYLSDHNWRVHVVTLLPHYPQYRIHNGFERYTRYTNWENGVEVTRFRPWIVPRDNLPLRLLTESVFALQVFCLILCQRVDVVVVSSPYMFLGPVGLLVSRLKNVRFVWDVRDLTWLYPRATGKRTFGFDLLLERLMIFVASRADLLMTATEGLLSYFKDKPQMVSVLPNGVTDHFLEEMTCISDTDISLGRPRVLYAGLFGYNHALTTLIEAAGLCPDIEFVLAGDGPERSLLEEQVKTLGLSNVVFTGYLKKSDLLANYQQANLLVSHVRQHPLYKWTQPAKLWEYMATGRPVIHAGEGEVVQLMNEHNIGLTVSPEDPAALAEAIKYLLDHPEKAAQLGQRGRAFVEQHRRRSLILKRFSEMLDELVSLPVTEQ